MSPTLQPGLTERDSQLEAKLAKYLSDRKIYAFKQVSSTMDLAHQLAVEGAPEGTLVWAERQARGRGRVGRTWASPPGGLYCSIILRPARPAAEVPQLSLVAGLAAAEAIREVAGLAASIHWPNDLLIKSKKVAGILVESRAPASTQHTAHSTQNHVIVGVGMNVTTGPNDLPEMATSLAEAMSTNSRPEPRAHSPELIYRLTGELCHRLSRWYDVWSREGFKPVREAMRPWIHFFGQPVRIQTSSGRTEGTASNVDESGRLLVRLDSGVLRAFDVGEVTLLR